jgi:outer membrane protein insertion porin family
MSQKSFLFSFFLLHLFFLFAPDLKAQLASDEIDLGTLDIANPKSYELAGITVTGARFLDNDALISLSGLAVGDQLLVPGEKITKCIENLWKQGLFSDIRISVKQIKGSKIYLEFVLQERARVSKFTFKGIKKGDIDKLREKIKLVKGQVITDNLIRNAEKLLKNIT